MNLKRFWDRNNQLIIIIAGIILFLLLMIELLDFYYKGQEEKRQIKLQEIIEEEKKDESEFTEADFSVESDTVKKAMRSFVRYCNEKQIDKAYQMLTDDCKQELYPTIEKFQENYIDVVYSTKRDYEITKWSVSGNTEVYLVNLYEDMLATGGLGDIRDEYYTFSLDKNGIYKLNVNNFIKTENKNKETIEDGIKVKIGQVAIYSDSQKIDISITNDTNKKVSLTGKRSDSIYLESSSGTEYSAFDSEFLTSQVILEPNEKRSFTISFNKYYDLSNPARYLVLDNIIMDYDEFINSESKNEYSNIKTIKVGY